MKLNEEKQVVIRSAKKEEGGSSSTAKKAKKKAVSKKKASKSSKKKVSKVKTDTEKASKKKVSKKKVTKKKVSKKKVIKVDGDKEDQKKTTKKKATKKSRLPAQYDLVIVESPTKAKTIKKYLGKGYEVIASNGHIKDLPKSKLGVDVENNFEIEMAMISGKKTVLEKLHKYISMANAIYLAPDPDREGEAIAFHISDEVEDKKRVYRVLFNAITKSEVKEAIAHPVKLNKNMYDSQKARRILDRLVGYKISPILWDKVQRGLSAGRVQSVALRLMTEREESIKTFVSEKWFSIEVDLQKETKIFKAKYYGDLPTKKSDLTEQSVVDNILKQIKDKEFEVTEIKKRERKQNPTPPFTTSKLQQEASTKLGFSSKKTMMVAQKLYEGIEISDQGLNGLITYMRTDSVRVSDEALNEVRSFISEKYGTANLSLEPIIYKKKGKSKIQDAHEAIRPASLSFSPDLIKNDLSSDEFRLYELIWNKFVSSQMSQAIIDQTNVTFKVSDHYFKANGSIIKFPGFRTIYLEAEAEKQSKKGGDEDNKISNRELPNMVTGELLGPKGLPEGIEHWTSPPPRYSDASIVKDLEEKGIGRPSTYATIISTLIDRGYAEKIETRYVPTELGAVVCQMLTESFPDIMDVAFTAKVEDLLDGIEEGSVKWTSVLSDFWGPFEKTLERAKEEMKNLKKTKIPTGLKCNKCDEGEYYIKWGRNGQFLTCSRYPDCTSTEDFKKHLDGTYEIIPKTYTEDPCPTCGKRMVVKKGRFGRFLACEDYPICKTTLPYTLNIICPECNEGKFAEKKSRFGSIFYGCSKYPDCNNAMWTMPKAHPCPECGYPVMGVKTTKRLGIHLACPKCKHTIPIEETPYAEECRPKDE